METCQELVVSGLSSLRWMISWAPYSYADHTGKILLVWLGSVTYYDRLCIRLDAIPTADILSGKNAQAWVSMDFT